MADQSIKEGIHRANAGRRVRALAYLPLGGGSYQDTVTGRTGFIWVRTLGVGGSSLAIVKDLIGLAASPGADDNAPIWIEPQTDGTWAATERRWEG